MQYNYPEKFPGSLMAPEQLLAYVNNRILHLPFAGLTDSYWIAPVIISAYSYIVYKRLYCKGIDQRSSPGTASYNHLNSI